jgi:hypothetical protein
MKLSAWSCVNPIEIKYLTPFTHAVAIAIMIGSFACLPVIFAILFVNSFIVVSVLFVFVYLPYNIRSKYIPNKHYKHLFSAPTYQKRTFSKKVYEST